MNRLERKDRTALQPLKMVDIADKFVIKRIAEAEGTIWLQTGTIEKIRQGEIAKGDVLAAANTAGILAAKKTPEIIPLCHLIPLSQVDVEFVVNERSVTARCKVIGLSKTGVEMEALVGVRTALLTI